MGLDKHARIDRKKGDGFIFRIFLTLFEDRVSDYAYVSDYARCANPTYSNKINPSPLSGPAGV